MYFVYILYSKAFDKYYVGHTSSIERRIKEHNQGFNKSTKPYIPWELLDSVKKNEKAEGYQLELKLKKLSKVRKLDFVKNIVNNFH